MYLPASATTNFFSTNDGVSLHYLEVLSGSPSSNVLVLLPGWSQTANQYVRQLEYFSASGSIFGRVIALDPRGHGQSEKPNHGYRLGRLAMDIDNLLDHLETDKDCCFHVLSHAAHGPILWTYSELFGFKNRFKSMVWVDQMLCYTKSDPSWSAEECAKYGLSADQSTSDLMGFAQLVASSNEAITRGILRGMFSDKLTVDDFDEIVEDNMKLPRPYAAQMLWSVMSGDYRDILPVVDIPVLCVGGSNSFIPSECAHYQASLLPKGEAKIVPGSHFMFYEEHQRIRCSPT